MKQKINARLILIAFLAIVSTAVSVTFVYYDLFKKQVKNDLKITAEILQETHYFESPDILTDSINISNDNGKLRVTWIDSDGTVLYDNDANAAELGNHLDRPEIQEAFETGTGESVRRSDTMNMNTFYYAVLLDNGTVLRVARMADTIAAVFFTAVPTIIFIVAFITIVCVLLSHLLTRQLIRPIEVMAENIEDTEVEPPYKELVPFAAMIRKQHTDILSAAKLRQDFTANVSHELKTPLTAISGYAELMENHLVDETQQEHFLQEIRKNSDRLLTLINDIIRLSQLDHAEKGTQFEELDLYQEVSGCMDALSVDAGKRKVNLSFKGDSCKILGNREMIRELTDNLVQNAIKYNNENGNVWVNVIPGQSGKGAILVVKDDGIGIPKEDTERVFERFYRVDKSRSKATGGTGLGLAIVKHIVEIHSARIELNSTLGKGTEIKIYF